ncbi:MAG: hypothetical protein AAFN94_16935 [Pseudomonadota bacterium]
MSDPLLRLPEPEPVARAGPPALPVGRQLVNAGVIDQDTLLKSLTLQQYIDAPLGEILVSNGDADRGDVTRALSVQYATDAVDLATDPPTPAMAQAMPATLCQGYCALPWRWFGDTLLVATNRPDLILALRAALGPRAPRLLPVIASRDDITAGITALYGDHLATRALTRVPERISSRTWSLSSPLGVAASVMVAGLLVLGFFNAPAELITGLMVLSVAALAMTSALKLGALAAQFLRGVPADSLPLSTPATWKPPRISMLVPLYHEENIADALIERLKKLTYPKALLEVVLVLEAKDQVTTRHIRR